MQTCLQKFPEEVFPQEQLLEVQTVPDLNCDERGTNPLVLVHRPCLSPILSHVMWVKMVGITNPIGRGKSQ